MAKPGKGHFAKIWDLVLSDPHYKSLKCIERGVFLQLIVLAKNGRDDGSVVFSDWHEAGKVLACDARTCSKSATKLQQKCFISVQNCTVLLQKCADLLQKCADLLQNYEESPSGSIVITLRNYTKWQQLRRVTDIPDNPTPVPEKPLLDKIRLDKIRVEEESTNSDKSEQEESRIQEFVDLFHSECPTLPRVRDITEPRKRVILGLLKKQPDMERWRKFFAGMIHASDYLAGRKIDWKASFDWIFKPANFQKIKEGNYQNKSTIPARVQHAAEDAVHDRSTQPTLAEIEARYMGATDE